MLYELNSALKRAKNITGLYVEQCSTVIPFSLEADQPLAEKHADDQTVLMMSWALAITMSGTNSSPSHGVPSTCIAK